MIRLDSAYVFFPADSCNGHLSVTPHSDRYLLYTI